MDVSSSVEGKAVHAALAALGCRAVSVELLQGRETDTLYNSMRPVVASEGGKKGANESQGLLWHGTDSLYGAQGISKAGFDNRYFNLKGKFGPGAYLADDLAKSHAYTRYIPEMGGRVVFLCKALLGNIEEIHDLKDRVARAGPKPGFQSVHWNGLHRHGKGKYKETDSGYYDEYIVYRYGQAIPFIRVTYVKLDEHKSDPDRRSSPSEVLSILALMKGAIERYCKDEQLAQVMREFGPLVSRCEEVVTAMEQAKIETEEGLLGRFVEELLSSLALLEKWHDELGKKFNFKVVFQSKARLARYANMVAAIRSMHEEMMQIVQARAAEQANSNNSKKQPLDMVSMLSSTRKGLFTDYKMIKNSGARRFWSVYFPGRRVVPWGEFLNVLRWEDFMAHTDDLNRTRAFFWLKTKHLDPESRQTVTIEAWAKFVDGTSEMPFEKRIEALFSMPVPGEDSVDAIHTKSEKNAPASSPGKVELVVDIHGELEKLDVMSSKGVTAASNVWSVEICILMDCTKSMKAQIDKIKECIRSIFARAESVAAGARVRVAFCGYRDIGDAEPLTILPFCSSPEEFITHVNQFGNASGGGGDAAEDVLGGLQAAENLDWSFGKSTAKRLIHIGDAPSHGTRYHSFAERTKPPSWETNQNDWDRFADTDSDGEQGKRLMRALAAKKVDYTFLEVVPFTQKMTNQFRDWYNECQSKHLPMEVIACPKADLIPDLVAQQVLASIKAAAK